MSSRTWTNVAVGVVFAVAAYFTFGISAVMGGFALGYTAASIVQGPESPKQGTMRPDELQMAQSSESVTVPVIFGTVRLAGNYMAYDLAKFKAKKIYAEQEGGKGGGGGDKQQTGFEYYLTWDLGLCMGPVDMLRAIQGSPGLDPLFYDNSTSLDGAGQATFEFSALPDDGATLTIGDIVYTYRTLATLPYEVPRGVLFGLDTPLGIVKAINGERPGTPAHPDVFAEGGLLTFTVRSKKPAGEGNGILLINTAPGEWDNPITSGGIEPIDLSAGPVNLTLDAKGADGGPIIVFPGNRTQVSPGQIEGITMNYRDICYVRFNQFNIGNSPAPRSYLFELQRMPVCVDSDGDVIEDFITRASLNPEDAEYNDANPAAIIWEFQTNKVWGKGKDPSALNESDFKIAAAHLAGLRMGVSTALGDDTALSEQVSRFRDLFGLVTWFDGSQIRCLCMYDRSQAYNPRNRITPEDIIGEPAFSRQSMASTTNEIRLEFTNRQNGWQKEAVTAMDLASVQTIGGARSLKIDGTEIGTRRCAEVIAHRMLRQFAYPPATCQITLRRGFTALEPGSFIELISDSWRTEPMTTFWRLDSVEDNETDAGELVFNLVEDIYSTGYEGEDQDFLTPVPSTDFDTPLTNEDLIVVNYQRLQTVGDIRPVLVDEPNIWISKGIRTMFAAIQPRNGTIQSFTVAMKESSIGNFTSVGVFQGFAITGQLKDALTATGPKIIRDGGNQFRLTLANPDVDGPDLIESASSVQIPSDGLDLLTSEGSAIMIIGQEIIRCGYITNTGENEYTVRVAIRGEQATDILAHAAGSIFHFLPFYHKSKCTQPAPTLPIDVPMDIRLQPQLATGFGAETYVTGPDAGSFSGRSIQPLRPELVSATRAGNIWTIILRPRIYNGGSNYGPDFETEMKARETDVGFHRVQLSFNATTKISLGDYFESGSMGTSVMTVTKWTYTPPDGTDPAKGVWTVVVQFSANPAQISLFGLLSGQISEPLIIPIP